MCEEDRFRIFFEQIDEIRDAVVPDKKACRRILPDHASFPKKAGFCDHQIDLIEKMVVLFVDPNEVACIENGSFALLDQIGLGLYEFAVMGGDRDDGISSQTDCPLEDLYGRSSLKDLRRVNQEFARRRFFRSYKIGMVGVQVGEEDPFWAIA